MLLEDHWKNFSSVIKLEALGLLALNLVTELMYALCWAMLCNSLRLLIYNKSDLIFYEWRQIKKKRRSPRSLLIAKRL